MILKLSMNYYKLTIIINALLLLGISNNALSQQSSKYKLLEVPKNNPIKIPKKRIVEAKRNFDAVER